MLAALQRCAIDTTDLNSTKSPAALSRYGAFNDA